MILSKLRKLAERLLFESLRAREELQRTKERLERLSRELADLRRESASEKARRTEATQRIEELESAIENVTSELLSMEELISPIDDAFGRNHSARKHVDEIQKSLERSIERLDQLNENRNR